MGKFADGNWTRQMTIVWRHLPWLLLRYFPRATAFMMVYDVLKSAGVLGIMLNEEEGDDEDDLGGLEGFPC